MDSQNSLPPKQPRLLDQVRGKLRLLHYSKRTEESYVNWIIKYILFHDKTHPKDMGAKQIEEFLTHLAVDKNVAASTQNQAFAAILFGGRKGVRLTPARGAGVNLTPFLLFKRRKNLYRIS